MTAMIGPQDMGEWMHWVERKLEEVATAALRRPALNRVENGDFTVANGGDVIVDPDGAVRSSDFAPGTTGWRLTEDSAEFNDLTLRGGIIGNDALTHPVIPDTANVKATNFAVNGGSHVAIGTAVKTVPPGCTGLLVTATGWVFARNPHTTGGVDGVGTDALYCYVRVSGSDGNSDSDQYGQGVSGFNGFTTATAGVSAYKAGLTAGEQVTLRIYTASSVQTLPPNAANKATLSATLLWIR